MRLCSECQMDNLLLVLTPSRVEKKSETTDGIAPAALRVETGMPPGTLHRTIHPGRPKFDGRHCIGERRLRSGMWNHSPSFVLPSSSLHFTTYSLSILPSRRSFVAFCEKDGLPADSEIRVTGSGVWLVLTTGAAPDASSNLQQSGQPSHLSFFYYSSLRLLLFGAFIARLTRPELSSHFDFRQPTISERPFFRFIFLWWSNASPRTQSIQAGGELTVVSRTAEVRVLRAPQLQRIVHWWWSR